MSGSGSLTQGEMVTAVRRLLATLASALDRLVFTCQTPTVLITMSRVPQILQ